jgi:RNA-binding protein 39
MNEEDIAALFAPFGELESVHLPKDPEGISKDHAFVCFKNPDDAMKALEATNKK